MAWPPQAGEPLPRAAKAVGVREKLVAYSLNLAHERGGSKARGFERILGITISHIDYVEAEIRAAILATPISAVRGAVPSGFNCVVDVPIRGLGEKSKRVVSVRTVWLLTGAGDLPRMTTAFPKP